MGIKAKVNGMKNIRVTPKGMYIHLNRERDTVLAVVSYHCIFAD